MSKANCAIIFLFALSFFSFGPLKTQAYQLEKLSNVPVSGDFVLNQTKTEVSADPGENISRSISLTNRTGADLSFSVSVEDFSNSALADQNIDLLGSKAGLYSLKDYLRPEADVFVLHHGERIALPIAIRIPQSAQPGGLYGAVIFSARPVDSKASGSANIQAVSRLASLFFVRVNGEVEENGRLTDFSSGKLFYFGGPVVFEFNYRNSGSVYLNPYGILKVTDIFGRETYAKIISPYFVLPGAIRQQKETLDRRSLWGAYRATLQLNRGYGNQIDQKSFYFFVLPVPYIVSFIITLALLAWLAWRIRLSFKKTNSQ